MKIKDIYENEELLEVGRQAIQTGLVEYRDNRISILGRNNGLVIRERDGKASSIIRMGPEEALLIGLKAIEKHLKDNK